VIPIKFETLKPPSMQRQFNRELVHLVSTANNNVNERAKRNGVITDLDTRQGESPELQDGPPQLQDGPPRTHGGPHISRVGLDSSRVSLNGFRECLHGSRVRNVYCLIIDNLGLYFGHQAT
jgi:hypothetical protein